jgi:hypothetical protein
LGRLVHASQAEETQRAGSEDERDSR